MKMSQIKQPNGKRELLDNLVVVIARYDCFRQCKHETCCTNIIVMLMRANGDLIKCFIGICGKLMMFLYHTCLLFLFPEVFSGG